jgi:DNA-directed RNA polymerase specialized sigma24 family protein
MLTQADIDLFRQTDTAYKDALAEAETLKLARDQVIYRAHLAGASYSELATGTGLSVPRIQQIVNRARTAADV